MTEYLRVGRSGICMFCGHPEDKHAFDVFPNENPNKPCELSCMTCFDEETERLKNA